MLDGPQGVDSDTSPFLVVAAIGAFGDVCLEQLRPVRVEFAVEGGMDVLVCLFACDVLAALGYRGLDPLEQVGRRRGGQGGCEQCARESEPVGYLTAVGTVEQVTPHAFCISAGQLTIDIALDCQQVWTVWHCRAPIPRV